MSLKTLSGKLLVAVLATFYVCLNIKIILQQSNEKQIATERIRKLENDLYSCNEVVAKISKQNTVPASVSSLNFGDILPKWTKLEDHKIKVVGHVRSKRGN